MSRAEAHAINAARPGVARLNGCKKVAFTSERAARDRAKVKRRAPGYPEKLTPYECRTCPAGTWHLTSSESRRRG